MYCLRYYLSQKFCKLISYLGMPDHTHRTWWYQIVKNFMFICIKNSTSSHTLFIRYYTLKNLANWLAENIMTHNLRTRIFPNMGSALGPFLALFNIFFPEFS